MAFIFKLIIILYYLKLNYQTKKIKIMKFLYSSILSLLLISNLNGSTLRNKSINTKANQGNLAGIEASAKVESINTKLNQSNLVGIETSAKVDKNNDNTHSHAGYLETALKVSRSHLELSSTVKCKHCH